jgi:hypothetical protein
MVEAAAVHGPELAADALGAIADRPARVRLESRPTK